MKTFRILLSLFSICVVTSCDYFSFQKKKILTPLDTVIDFGSVDTPPTFMVCQDLIIKQKQDSCFSHTLSEEFTKELLKPAYLQKITVKTQVDGVISLIFSIDSQGFMKVKNVKLSSNLAQEIPELELIFQEVILKIPKVYPAIKRGIPVATEYRLPIRLKF